MSKLKFYYDLLSQPSRGLYIFLNLTKIPHENKSVALRKAEHLTDEYKENINRFQKVPCIIDNDFKLAECVAIFRYLAREHKIPDNLYPEDSKVRAKVDEYLEWQHNNIRSYCALYFRYVWMNPLLGRKVNPEKAEEMKDRMSDNIDLFQEIWLNSNNKFIAGNEISVADILAACELEQPKIAGYDPTIGRPKLKEYMELVRQTTNPYYDEAHKILYKFLPENIAKPKL
uniref:glutathione transferase n=1 Tax=Corethrella appendiculata TaxID=1370023 RepID=U5EXP6_9DIPT